MLLQIICLEIAQDLSYQKICLEFDRGMGTTIQAFYRRPLLWMQCLRKSMQSFEIKRKFAWVAELVDARDLKSLGP